MTVYAYISLIFLLVFIGVSIDIFRNIRSKKLISSKEFNSVEIDHDANIHFDAEDEESEISGWKSNDFLKREEIKREIPLNIDDITPIDGKFLDETTTPLIVCPPTMDGMVAAALMLKHIPWANVQVVYKDYFVKSIWKFMRLKPKPDHIIIIGINAGYVHGRRLIQTFSKMKEQGLKFTWYDNHKWIPVIAKNINDLCYDFQLVSAQIRISNFIRKRFFQQTAPKAEKILTVLDSFYQTGQTNLWSNNWKDLLNYTVVDGTGIQRIRLVKRLAKLAAMKPLDYLFIYQYRKKQKLTKEILRQQAHFVPLHNFSGRMSVVDLRPFHREQSPNGKTYFVFRGEKPTYELPEYAFKIQNPESLLIIQSLTQMELYRRPNSELKLSRLIDITSVNGTQVKIDGRDEKVIINLNISLLKRFFYTVRFLWPPEIQELIEKIKYRL